MLANTEEKWALAEENQLGVKIEIGGEHLIENLAILSEGLIQSQTIKKIFIFIDKNISTQIENDQFNNLVVMLLNSQKDFTLNASNQFCLKMGLVVYKNQKLQTFLKKFQYELFPKTKIRVNEEKKKSRKFDLKF